MDGFQCKRVWALLPALCLLLALSMPVHAQSGIRLPIVMYHHISQDPAQWNDYVISPEEFESDLHYLTAHGYTAISGSELLRWYDGDFTMPEKPCLLTFDDGFESTMAYAEPLLQHYGCRAVVAVIGSVAEQFSACDEHDPEWSNLSWEDCAQLQGRGVIEIACHTWDMHHLQPRKGCGPCRGEPSGNYAKALSDDLTHFQAACQAHALSPLPVIAYPYGFYSAETGEIVRTLGFQAAFTCTERVNVLSGETAERYELGRYNRPHGIDSATFFAQWDV